VSTAPDKAARSSTEIQTNIGQDVDHFVSQIDGLAETLPLANVAVHGTRLRALQEYNAFLKTVEYRLRITELWSPVISKEVRS
jgi:hypothetical protein